MHQKLISFKDYEKWRKNLPESDVTASALKSILIRERLESHLLLLDESYGADRTLNDLGGFIAVVEGSGDIIAEEIKRILNQYNLNVEEYEYVDTYRVPELQINVEFRLYLCSSDYAVELMIITNKETEEVKNENN